MTVTVLSLPMRTKAFGSNAAPAGAAAPARAGPPACAAACGR
jgi:hypothetical protein